MKTQTEMATMNPTDLLNYVATGTLTKDEALLAATLLEQKFPTPKNSLKLQPAQLN